MSEKTVPALRFKGFGGDWERKKLGEVVAYEQPTSYIVNSTKYEDTYATPVLTAGQSFILGYTDETEGIKMASQSEPLIIFDDFTTSSHYVDFPFKVKSSAMKLLTLKEDNFDFNFFFNVLTNLDYAPQSHERHWISKFSKFSISVPIYKEQTAIGDFFRSLDALISLQSQKLGKLVTMKKAMLSKMFPKDGETVPELRFKGFSGDWERKKLGEVGETQSGIGFPDTEQGGKQGIPFFKVSDMNNIGNEDEMVTANNYVTQEQIKQKKWNPIESLPAIIFAKVGAAIMLDRKRLILTPFLLDNNTMAYIFDDSLNVGFTKTLFETIYLPKYVQVGALPSYNGSEIEEIDILFPTLPEQTSIGSFFQNFDTLITLQKQELEKLKTIKKSLLSKMFV